LLKLVIAGADAAHSEPPDITFGSGLQVWRDHDGAVCAYGHTVGSQHWMHLPGLASFSFDQGVEEVTAIPHGRAQDPAREDLILDTYYRTVLPMALQSRGWEVLHASGILTPRGVVALCGVSGNGKSTMAFGLSQPMAFGLSQRGWPLWADDAVAFETLETGIRISPLPFSIRLRPEAAAFFERNTVPIAESERGPHTYSPAIFGASDAYHGKRTVAHANLDRGEAQHVPLAALFVLNRTHDGSDEAGVQVRQLSSTQAFLGVLAHAYVFSLQDLTRKQSMMRHYLDLVAQVPVFEISFRPGLERLPAILSEIRRLVLNLE